MATFVAVDQDSFVGIIDGFLTATEKRSSSAGCGSA